MSTSVLFLAFSKYIDLCVVFQYSHLVVEIDTIETQWLKCHL